MIKTVVNNTQTVLKTDAKAGKYSKIIGKSSCRSVNCRILVG